ncbi:MAG: nucleoside-diphosphate sugar epimerase [Cyclobacteriaceae bacterium]|nr:MAG: nucleoside-diphosphate sugar epimerase [Cyclobacteriaceae bacterium]
MKTALIAGATGLVGSFLLEDLLMDNRYTYVVAVTRRALHTKHPKLMQVVSDYDHLDDLAEQLKADDVFCCLGTTIRKAGSKQAFRKVDFEYPLKLAQITCKNGARNFLLVTALGANPASKIFYNRVKGEAEEAIRRVGFFAFHIFRPSLLLGNRSEHRTGEAAAKWFYKIFNPVIPLRYKAIHARTVARAMVHFAHTGQPGVFIHESDEIQMFAP